MRPTTDDTDKSVGIVYIALATPNGVASERFDLANRAKKSSIAP
jgi:nicotinamide mononucleotide (NMN) deamidase PncC